MVKQNRLWRECVRQHFEESDNNGKSGPMPEARQQRSELRNNQVVAAAALKISSHCQPLLFTEGLQHAIVFSFYFYRRPKEIIPEMRVDVFLQQKVAGRRLNLSDSH